MEEIDPDSPLSDYTNIVHKETYYDIRTAKIIQGLSVKEFFSNAEYIQRGRCKELATVDLMYCKHCKKFTPCYTIFKEIDAESNRIKYRLKRG